jgi:hypothetical protein
MTVIAETTTAGSYEVATPAELERIVMRMSAANPYVVVTRDDRKGFAQTHLEDGRSVLVEYRLSDRSLLRRAHLPRERAAAVLAGWAFDHDGWKRGIAWESDRFEQYVDVRSHCAFSATASGVSCRLAGAAPEGLEWLWEIEATEADEDAAYAEWITRSGVAANLAPPAARIASGELYGSWVVQGVRRPLRLSAEQCARIDASSPASWTGVREN